MTSKEDGSGRAKRAGQLLCLSISGLFGPLLASLGSAAGVAEAATLQPGAKAGSPVASQAAVPAASVISPGELAVANERLADAQVRLLGDAKVYVSRQGRYLGRTDAMGRHYDAHGRLLGMMAADGQLRGLPDYRSVSPAHARAAAPQAGSPSALAAAQLPSKLAQDDATVTREHQMAAIMPPSARAALGLSSGAASSSVSTGASSAGASRSTAATVAQAPAQSPASARSQAPMVPVVPLPSGRPGQDAATTSVAAMAPSVTAPLITSDGRIGADPRAADNRVADVRVARRVQAEPQRLVQLEARQVTRGAAGVRGALAPAGISTQPVALGGMAGASSQALAMAAVSHEMTHLNEQRVVQPAGGVVAPAYGGQPVGSHARMRTVATTRASAASMRPVVYEPGRIVLQEGADQHALLRH